MPDSATTSSPPGLLAGYRTQISALVLGLWNLARVFGLVHVTEEQSTAINGALLGAIALFGALKISRVQGTASATAATAIATAKEVGAVHTPDPAAPPAEAAP